MALHVMNIYHPRGQSNRRLWMNFATRPFSAEVEGSHFSYLPTKTGDLRKSGEKEERKATAKDFNG